MSAATSAVFQSHRPPPPPAANRKPDITTTTPMNGSTRSRPPPPPLRLQQSAFSSASASSRRNTSRERTRDVASPTGRGGTIATPTNTTVPLLYELPPSSSSPRLRAAQLQQEKAKIRATLQTQYRLQQANAISGRSMSDGTDSMKYPRPIPNGRPMEDPLDYDIGSPTTPIGRFSMSGPPSSRPRSVTPSHAAALMSPVRSDLEEFAQRCKSWFFAQDAEAGKAMTATLAAIPPSQKATFTKLQASVRAAYHTSTSLRRLQDYRAMMASSIPGGSLSPAARALPWGPQARKERHERFARFLMAHCLVSAPGTHPFFEGLYGVLRLQAWGETAGGAGPHRIEWEIDDAIFLESGGKEFTKDAIDALKGVLGFEERLTSTDTTFEELLIDPNQDDSDTESSLLEDVPHAQSIVMPTSQPTSPSLPLRVRRSTNASLPSPASESTPSLVRPGPSPIPSKFPSAQSSTSFLGPNRGRASSDPFSDPLAGSSPGQGPSSSYLAKIGGTTALGGIGEHEKVFDTSASPPPTASTLPPQHSRHLSQPLPASSSFISRLGFSHSHSQSNSMGPSTPVDEFPPTSPSYAAFLQHDLDLDRLLSSPAGPYGITYKPPTQAELDLLHTAQLRVWVVPPYITNPEIDDLIAIFPSFISKKPVPKFKHAVAPQPSKGERKRGMHVGDLEEGIVMEVDETAIDLPALPKGEVKKGTGRMWIGARARDDGWKGGVWARFMLWLKGMFR